ncbi:condensation domain-containing protein, partial [Mycobacterium sp. LTG2003]
MQLDERSLPVTRAQLDVWLAQDMAHAGTEWQLGLFVRIAGTVDRDALEWAIRRVIDEAEPVRVTFFEVDGMLYQRPLDHPPVELDFHDLRGFDDPVQEARTRATLIQNTPMPFTGPLFKFTMFQTRVDEFFLMACCHHIVLDGTGIALVGHRIAAVYSAVVSGASVPPALFGSLSDLVGCESEYEASPDYIEDQVYWSENLPPESDSIELGPQAADEFEACWPSEQVRLDPAVVRRVEKLAQSTNIPRSSIVTAACALLALEWCAEGRHVVLDFPVSRRVLPESKTLPAMMAGVVPLVLTPAPESSIASFCEHVHSRIREALQHQRFPVHALERSVKAHEAGKLGTRLSINFLPSTFTLDFGGASAYASLINAGVVGGFGLIFSGTDEELALSTMGAAQPFSDLGVTDIAE